MLMSEEEFALLRFGQHNLEHFPIWVGIVLKSCGCQKEMMVLGQQEDVLSRKVKPS